MRLIRIVVTCTNRKRQPVPAALHLRAVTAATVVERCERWLAALQGVEAVATRADGLYCGDAWQVARSLPAAVSVGGEQVELWVASAGYGLVRAGMPLKPYAATFALGEPDSVVRASDRGDRPGILRRWWAALSAWPGPGRQAPRSIAALAAEDPTATLLVVASAAYLAALTDDVLAARTELASPDRLLVVSAGSPVRGPLAENLLPVDARLQLVLGGARHTINVRAARWVLSATSASGRLTFAAARERLACLLSEQPTTPCIARARISNDEVRRFVEDSLRVDPGSSRTELLRRLRNSGRACEQGRFASIVRVVESAT